jgi:hypothetical protein
MSFMISSFKEENIGEFRSHFTLIITLHQHNNGIEPLGAVSYQIDDYAFFMRLIVVTFRNCQGAKNPLAPLSS